MLINGVIMINDSVVQDGLYPGQPMHCEHETEGLFEPLERESHLDKLLAPGDEFLLDNLDSHRNE